MPKIHEGESGHRLWEECIMLGIEARKVILACYLHEDGIVPEKCNLNLILFLLASAESEEKLARLVTILAQFEISGVLLTVITLCVSYVRRCTIYMLALT